jgi:hypothetical protein
LATSGLAAFAELAVALRLLALRERPLALLPDDLLP